MDGKSYQKSISKAYPTKLLNDITEFILLAGIGAAGVFLHAYLRIPLKLPGHNGIIYMALLFSGRLISNKKFASSYSSIGAAFMLLIPLGFKDPFITVTYLFPGFIVDLLYNNISFFRKNIFFTALICGLAYMSIPITRMAITLITGFPYGSFINGFLFPVFTHFIFGFIGGLIPSGIKMFHKKKDN